jgi:hypothetical protein
MPSNKGMKLTKLSAAPTLAPQAALGRRCRRMPAPDRLDAGTASQLIPGVRQTIDKRGRCQHGTGVHRRKLIAIGPLPDRARANNL